MGRDQPDFPDYAAPGYLIDSRPVQVSRSSLGFFYPHGSATRVWTCEVLLEFGAILRAVDATMSHLDEARKGEERVPFAERMVPVPGSGTGSLVPAICNCLNLPVIIDTGALST